MSLMPHIAVKSALCAGVLAAGWFMFVAPKRDQLASTRATVAFNAEQIDAFSSGSLRDIGTTEDVIDAVQARVSRVAGAVTSSVGAEDIYRTIQALAADAGLTVNSMTPTRRGVVSQVEHVTFLVETSGTFTETVRFIADLESRLGISWVYSLRLRPDPARPGEDAVLASIGSVHFDFGAEIGSFAQTDGGFKP